MTGRGAAPVRVLMLEDSVLDADLIAEVLAAAMPEVRLIRVATEAEFRVAVADAPDLILSDYELAGFHGRDALALAQRLCPLVPVVFVTGAIGEDNAVALLRDGATDHVSKFRLERLPMAIARALREVRERASRAAAERRARASDDLFAKVVDELRDYAVLMLDPAGVVQRWNAGAEDIFGYSRDAAIGRTADFLFTDGARGTDVLTHDLHQALVDGKAIEARWMQRADGGLVRGEGVIVPLFDEARGHTGFCAIVHDTTEAHRYREQLESARDEAEQASRAKDRFLAMLSHELRNPLAPIRSAVHALRERLTLAPPETRLLSLIERNVDLEARLIDDLLDLGAIASGEVVLRRQALGLHAVCAAAVESMRSVAAARKVRIELQLAAARDRVTGDSTRLEQVLLNLLSNAVKFSPENGVVRLVSANEDDGLVIHCIDHGIGIAAPALDRLFKPFRQLDVDRRPDQGSGLGLGLAIAEGLVVQHGGSLSVQSAGPGQGATFTIRLPLASEAAADDGETARGPLRPERAGGRILLVEDNADALEAMLLLLESLGFQCAGTATVAGALERIGEGGIDVVITDLGLPDGSGVRIAEQAPASLPVIALTGYDRRLGIGAGDAPFFDYITKPAPPAVLVDVLARALKAGG